MFRKLAQVSTASFAVFAISTISAFGIDRQWEYVVTNDPFVGTLERVSVLAFDEDNQAAGLISISNHEGRISVSLVDTYAYFCPNHMGLLKVSVWFSDSGQIIESDWQVGRQHQDVEAMSVDGKRILDSLMNADSSIFRVYDACGELKDYRVTASNLANEWQRMAHRFY